MEFVLIVIADIYLHYRQDGQLTGGKWGSLYHEMPFDNEEACERYKDRHAEEIGRNLEGPYRAYWSREFDIPDRYIFVDIQAHCYGDES